MQREGDTWGNDRKEIQGIRLEGITARKGYDGQGIRREVRLEGDTAGRGYDGIRLEGNTRDAAGTGYGVIHLGVIDAALSGQQQGKVARQPGLVQGAVTGQATM